MINSQFPIQSYHPMLWIGLPPPVETNSSPDIHFGQSRLFREQAGGKLEDRWHPAL